MNPAIAKEWEDALNPDVLRPRLIRASIFIAAFEILKEVIVEKIYDFFCDGWNADEDIVSPEYATDVLRRNRSPIYASLGWLKDQGAITEQDIASFGRIKDCRNALAHGLQRMVLAQGLPADFEQVFQEMATLLKKIDLWWIVEFEIPTNPAFDNKEIDYDGILSGHAMVLSLLYHVGLASAEESTAYLKEFRERFAKQQGA